VSRPVVLHGGGEFVTGDEACVSAVLSLGAAKARADRPIRVVVVPTATARWSPERSAAHGVAAFIRVATRDGLVVEAEPVMVMDAMSAADPVLAARLASADVISFPGGDPDVIVSVMPGSPAWAAIERARASGAVLAGASAGAMALAPWTWTPAGGAEGLGIVPGLVVVPHADASSWDATVERFGAWAPAGLGALGLAERTAAITEDPTADPVRWRVVGAGEARWLAERGATTAVYRAGDGFETPGRPAR
jgi:cyanophycinase-like exopeptidase